MERSPCSRGIIPGELGAELMIITKTDHSRCLGRALDCTSSSTGVSKASAIPRLLQSWCVSCHGREN